MHPALKKGSLFYKKTSPVFHLFYKKTPPTSFPAYGPAVRQNTHNDKLHCVPKSEPPKHVATATANMHRFK